MDEITDMMRPGGLMRCCTETIGDLYPLGPARIAREGQMLQCKYTISPDHRMIFTQGAWQWYRPEEWPEQESPLSAQG